jgi:hypothetical protein
VFIENNPFHCDCLLYHFIRYLGEKIKNIEIPGYPKCYSPSALENRTLRSLNDAELLCELDDPQNKTKNCKYFVRPSDKYLVITCTSQNMDLPLQLPTHASLNNIELHFENSSLIDMTSLGINRQIFNDIKDLYVAGNNISKLTVDDIPNNITVTLFVCVFDQIKYLKYIFKKKTGS